MDDNRVENQTSTPKIQTTTMTLPKNMTQTVETNTLLLTLMKQMQNNHKQMNERIQNNHKQMSERIQNNHKQMSERIQNNHRELSNKLEGLMTKLESNQVEIRKMYSNTKNKLENVLVKESVEVEESMVNSVKMVDVCVQSSEEVRENDKYDPIESKLCNTSVEVSLDMLTKKVTIDLNRVSTAKYVERVKDARDRTMFVADELKCKHRGKLPMRSEWKVGSNARNNKFAKNVGRELRSRNERGRKKIRIVTRQSDKTKIRNSIYREIERRHKNKELRCHVKYKIKSIVKRQNRQHKNKLKNRGVKEKRRRIINETQTRRTNKEKQNRNGGRLTAKTNRQERRRNVEGSGLPSRSRHTVKYNTYGCHNKTTDNLTNKTSDDLKLKLIDKHVQYRKVRDRYRCDKQTKFQGGRSTIRLKIKNITGQKHNVSTGKIKGNDTDKQRDN